MKLGENLDKDVAMLETLTDIVVAVINRYEDDDSKGAFTAALIHSIAEDAGLDLTYISLMNLKVCGGGEAFIKECEANETEHDHEKEV